MKIKIIRSTKPNFVLDKNDAVVFSGKSAGICYMKDDVETLFDEDEEKTLKRANSNISMGHHSVFGHVSYNLIFEDVPKILAIILNNEKVYNTSEKSARYTKMRLSSSEEALYNKYIDIFTKLISNKYPNLGNVKIKKLAMENARYFISVFSPSTTMEYTTNFCQLNYIINWAKDFISDDSKNSIFDVKLKKVLEDFVNAVPDLEVDGLDSSFKHRSFSVFATRDRKDEFGENYCYTYKGSFAQLAQAQRHRTLAYEFKFLEDNEFYVPQIIQGTEFEGEYKKDIASVADMFPQGMLLKINERGTIENFVLKCKERICGQAQKEIMDQSVETLNTYINALKQRKDLELVSYLAPFENKPRCLFPNSSCSSPCIFGPLKALEREI